MNDKTNYNSIPPCELYHLEKCPKYQLTNGWCIQGSSKAGFRTGYYIQNINIIVDCGFYSDKEPTAVFMTHRHIDHSSELTKLISYRSPKKGQESLLGRPVFMPNDPATLTGINYLIKAEQILSSGIKILNLNDTQLYKRFGIQPFPVDIGSAYKIPGLRDYEVEILPAYHKNCMSVGYGFNEIRQKLKPEYVGLDNKKIIEIKKTGEQLTYEVKIPVVLIYGDTTPYALTKHEEWKKYPNVFIECTCCEFEEDTEKAKVLIQTYQDRGHTHINELLPVLIQFKENRHWFIQHTSQSTDMNKFRELLIKNKLEETNCTIIK
jgi:ribonuclease Z